MGTQATHKTERESRGATKTEEGEKKKKEERGVEFPRQFGRHFLGAFGRAGGGGAQPRQDVLDPIGLKDVDVEGRADEFGLAHMRQQRDQRLPESVDVGQQNRLGVAAELLPGHLFDQFLQRADAAGQGDECIGMLEHQPLALVHVRRDDHFLNASQHMFPGPEEVRNDPGHGAAMVQRGFGDRTHQPDRSTAINQPDIVLGENLPQGEGGFDKARAGAGPGAAIDTNSFDLIHADHVAPHPGKLKSGGLRRCRGYPPK